MLPRLGRICLNLALKAATKHGPRMPQAKFKDGNRNKATQKAAPQF
jgi:hypothetical protein